jgi:ribosomal protein L7/L12
MSYIIKPYTKKQAEKLNVQIKPSRTKGKKIDVFKNGKKIASVGAAGMKDYPTYLDLEKKGKVETGTAEKRRKLYKQRHENDRKKKGTAGFYADKLLW